MNKMFFVAYLCLFVCLSCTENNGLGDNNWLIIPTNSVSFDYLGGEHKITAKVSSSVALDKIQYEMSDEGSKWCTVSVNNGQVSVKAERSYQEKNRTTEVKIKYDEGATAVLTVSQMAAPSSDDTKLKVINAVATSEETSGKDTKGNPLTLAMSYDNNIETYYNSKFGVVSYPFKITYELDGKHTLNRIVYFPRTDSGNRWGSFDEFTIEAASADNPNSFNKVGDFSRGENVQTPMEIYLNSPIKNIKYVRFIINKAYKDRVSCAEMEFYENSKNAFNISSIFQDSLCTILKTGITEKQIYQIPDTNIMNLGLALLNKTYDSSYRLASYRPYQDPSIMASKNKTSKYSLRDNVTGLYAKSGKPLTVIVGPLYKGAEISILIQNLSGGYSNYKTYALKEGYNKIIPNVGGLIYVLNHVSDDIPLLLVSNESKNLSAAKTIEIHFPMANVNGYFDITKNTESDWQGILNKATYQDIDVLGHYSHLTWRVSDFKKYNTNIIQTVNNLDNLVLLEEEKSGLLKYDKTFNNRMHISIDYKASSPNSSDYRVVFNASDYYAQPFCEPDDFAVRCWGPAHEIGHSNQVRPGFKWAGMTEVTNNLMCLWEQEALGQPCKLLVNGAHGNLKNYYEWAIDYIVNQKRAHCLPGVNNITRELQLVPFWQLKLYLIDVLGEKDFYKDLYEHYRVSPNLDTSLKTEGILQLDFVRQVCNLAHLNLLDFFKAWGFLSPVNTVLNDYSKKTFIITQEEINDLESEIKAKNYKEAPKELWKITENNLANYK